MAHCRIEARLLFISFEVWSTQELLYNVKSCSIFCQNMVTAIKLFRSISCLIDSVISENWLVRYQVYSTSIIILKAISLRSLHFLHSFKLPQKIDKVISVLVQSPTCISAAIPNSGSNSNIDESMYHCQNHWHNMYISWLMCDTVICRSLASWVTCIS